MLRPFLAAILLSSAFADSEHRVHNLILYPEKHSWCETTPIRQVIASPGHDAITIDNNICIGACYSYSIPATDPAEPGELIRPYCDSCQPSETQCYHVTLHNSLHPGETFQKRVEIIMNCACKSCRETPPINNCTSSMSELPENLFENRSVAASTTTASSSARAEVPDLLGFVAPGPNRSASGGVGARYEPKKYDLSRAMIELLKAIQDGGESGRYDDGEMRTLLKVIEGDDGELSDKNLMEFVNYVNVYDIDDFEVDLKRLKTVMEAFVHRRRHRLGDVIGLEHLVKGPHGSMVLSKVEEKFNIDLDGLKPNDDGTVIDYENHRQKNVVN